MRRTLLIAALFTSFSLAAIAGPSDITLTTPATASVGKICLADLHLNYQTKIGVVTWKECDASNVFLAGGQSYTFIVNEAGSRLDRPFAAPVVGSVTWASLTTDLAGVPSAVKTLMRRAVTGT